MPIDRRRLARIEAITQVLAKKTGINDETALSTQQMARARAEFETFREGRSDTFFDLIIPTDAEWDGLDANQAAAKFERFRQALRLRYGFASR